MTKFYLTTTLPYVNAEPHIGTALEFILADSIVRYFRNKLGKENVFFNIGTDEHGLKMFNGAQKEGLTPQEFVDKYAKRYVDFCNIFKIQYDNFYRTSSPDHHKKAQEFWRKSVASGDIYKKKYEGLYCVGCEEFKTEKDLVNGKCPLHDKEPIWFSEENYFFKLSKYKEQLIQWLNDNPDVVKPEHKANELKNFISQMEDISISRLKKNLPWGIEVPDDPEQVMYVWFDALTNYVIAVGFGDPEKSANFTQWWPGVQVFGPDNLRFQCAIWQAMLLSAKLEHTKKLLCHGMVLASDGTKMSKSVGNVVSPYVQAEKYGYEAVRYYIVTGIATYGDSAYKEDDLVNIYNSHLANNFGNLLNRVIHLANINNYEINNIQNVETDFKAKVDEFKSKAEALYEDFEIQSASLTTNELASFGNEYITQKQPWSKSITAEEATKVLNNLSYLLAAVIDLYTPIIFESSEKAKKALAEKNEIILFTKIEEKSNI